MEVSRPRNAPHIIGIQLIHKKVGPGLYGLAKVETRRTSEIRLVSQRGRGRDGWGEAKNMYAEKLRLLGSMRGRIAKATTMVSTERVSGGKKLSSCWKMGSDCKTGLKRSVSFESGTGDG